MKSNFRIAVLFTLVTTVLFGLAYPLGITSLLPELLFPWQSNGSLLTKDGRVIGSELIGQEFSSPGYFHSRPSYDASQSSGSNWGPTNHQLLDRVKSDLEKLQAENPSTPIPVDLVTASGSGLDPDISPAAAEFQVRRVAKERGIPEADVRALVQKHTLARQFGFLGEPRVRVLKLNLDLDAAYPRR